MKQFKISMIAVIAIVMGIAVSAFTTSKTASPDSGQLTTTWFQFMGTDPTDVSQVLNNQNYSYVDGTSCGGNQLICAVKSEGIASSGEHPDAFTDDLKEKLEDAVNNPSNNYLEISREP